MAGDGEDLLRQRVLHALELVHAPEAAAIKARGGPDERRRSHELLRHAWAILQDAYGVVLGRDFYAVHRVGDPRNCLLLTREEEQAVRVRDLWAGPAVEVSTVTAVDPLPERYVGMALALHWRPPPP